MLFRKRERFERTDVPNPSPYSNIIGGIVLAVVFVALFVVVGRVADRVGKETRLNDISLSKAVSKQSSMTVTQEGYSISQDAWTKVLLLTVSDPSNVKKGTTLVSAQALMIRDHTVEDGESAGQVETTATLANLPLEAKVTSDQTASTLADLCASKGAAACVVPVNAATNIKYSHVIVASDDLISQLLSLAGADPAALIADSASLVEKIRTDMSAEELVALATKVAGIGVENIQTVDAELMADTTTGADGQSVDTGFQAINRTQLCVAVGTLVN